VDSTTYRKNFRDIVRGYSSAQFGEREVYIKHLTPHDQVEIEEIEKKYHNDAARRGVPTEEDMLLFLNEEGDWTSEDDESIKKEKAFLENLLTAKVKIVLPSHMAKQDELIKESREKIYKKESERIELLGNTCERYAKERTNDYYIIRSFYKNDSLSKVLFKEKQFDSLDAIELRGIIALYNESFTAISEDSIQYLVLQDFYNAYISFTDDSMQFFGRPFCELTYCQIKLLVYSKIFKNIFENNDNIPEKIKKDPKALMDFASTSKEEKEKIQGKFDESDGSTLVGATQEDYQQLGLGAPGGVDLHEEAKKKGGSLSMDDLMKLSGVG
jgi:hypothetical protein